MLTTCPWCKELNFGRRAYCKLCGRETHEALPDFRCRKNSIRKSVEVTGLTRDSMLTKGYPSVAFVEEG